MKRFLQHITLILTMALVAITCTEDVNSGDENIPDGYGKLSFTIGTTDALATRAVNTTTPWLEGSGDERAIKSYVILICEGSTIVQALTSNTETPLGSHDDTNHYYPTTANIQSNLMSLGDHALTIYCLANFTTDMVTATGLTVSAGKVTNTTLPTNFETKVMQPIANGTSTVPTTGLPMTGKLEATVNIKSGQISTKDTSDKDLVLILWRMMAKLDFQFTNESNSKVRIKGIEVEPINLTTASGSGVYLISQDDDLTSLNNLAPYNTNETDNEAGVTATWRQHETSLQTEAVVSAADLLATAQLSYGSMLSSTGPITAQNAVQTTLQKFQYTGSAKLTVPNDNSAIILTVKSRSGLSFTPRGISFKACRGDTDSGKFDVVAINGTTSTTVATEVYPERYNRGTFISTYEYNLSGSATTGDYVVKIFLYDLDPNKEYAFSDIVISGIVKNTEAIAATTEGITLPDAARTDVGTVTYTPATALPLNATNGTGSLYFYVNETDASFTTTNNQLSLRFKIQRQKTGTTGENEADWYDDEIRYGMTIQHDRTSNGIYGGERGGFNVIRRNDWIHIPIHLTDWQFRIEPVAFAPIAGYPAVLLKSDALTAEFSTGGPIILKPFAQKSNDGAWRDFSDPEVQFVSLTWKNSDGTNVSGNDHIVKTGFAYDEASHSIVGVLNNNYTGSGTYKTTITVNVKLGPSGSQYDYSFTCNVILQK